MPKYVVDGQVYDIGDADVKSFEQAYPNAMQKYVVGEKKYNVPLAKREKFLGQFKDAVAMGIEGGGSAAGKVEAAGLDDAAASQADASASAVADAGKANARRPSSIIMMEDPDAFNQSGVAWKYGARNKEELDKAIAKEEAEKAAKAARRTQWDAEDSEIAKTYAPARPSSADEVMANYRGMFDLTEDGKRLNASIDKRVKELQAGYFQEYQGTQAYKDIVKAQEALGKRLNEGFWQKYGEQYKADMEKAYGGMQGITEAEVERAIKKHGKELQDRYFKEYQGTEEYKAIAMEQDALEKRLNDEFGAAYNRRLNDEMEGDYGKYNAALMERYGDRINAESKPFVTADYDKELIGRMDVNERMRRDYGTKYDDWYARFQSDHDARRKKFDPTTARIGGYAGLGGAMQINRESTPLQKEGAELRYNMSYLEHANRLDKQSKNILDEARRKGNTNFLSGLARGFGQNITWRDFTFGLADLEDSWRLKSVMRKAEEDPASLTKEETMLLDALTDNMAITAYYSDDLGKGYKAGQTTAVSIPFMLEMMANPIAGSGNAMAKSLLKYGLRKYGVSLAKKRALKMGTRILTDAAAATGMTLTTGAAGVASDANNRIVQDYDISKGEDGTYRVKRKGEVSDADAWTKAFLTRTLENQSEMFFNAFDGGGRVVADLFKPASSRVANTAAGKWAKEMIAAAGRTDIGQFVRGAIKNPTMRGLAERANFHGIGGEYLEEVYNNLVSIPLGETTWEEATDFDNNLETFIGLAPTSFVFGMFGAGGYMRDRYRINKQLSGMYDAADEQQRKMMTSIREAVLSGDRDGLKIQLGRILGSDLPAEVKRSLLDYTYKSQMAEAMDAADQVSADDRAQEARAQVESVADLANGAVVTVDRIHADGSTEAGHVVGWMDGSPMWIPDSDPSAQPVALRADEYDSEQMTSVPLEEARTQAADDAYRQESERVERETRYSPDITPYVSLVPGESFADADGNTYTVAMRGAGGTVVFDREDQNGGVTSVQLDEQAYMDLRQGGIDAEEAASHGSGPIIIGGGYRPAGANASNEAAPGSDNQTDNRTDGQEAGDSNMSGQDADVQSDETKNVPAMQRIPKDEQGNPLYEQTDSDTAWDAIVEQTDGDEVMAQTVADGMVADKEAALKKLEKSKSKGGVTVAEKIASEKERKAAIEAAQQELNIWKKIAGTANRRRTDAEAERRRVAETKEALRKEEEERLRAEREEAEGTADGERIKAESVQQDGTPPAVGVGSENTGRSERNDGSNVKGKNNIQTTEILTGEKKDLQERILGWLTDENIEWAEGKDINEVIEHFGNTPEPIAVMPPIVRKNVPSLDGDYLYCGKAYMIDHHANHHPELDIDEYINIQTILDNYDDIKDLSDDGKLKIAFVKKLDKCYAVVAELSKENDKIVLHKTFFYRDAAGKRVPYKNKPSILERWSVDGSTTISPAEVQQPADTENISALDQSISVSKDSENPSINQAKGGKVAENQNRSAVQDALAAAEQETNTDPTEGQKAAGNYKKGHFKIDGYDVTIEIPKGSVRRGTDSSGKQWEHEMHNTYGYIRGTEGVDGDHIDVFFSEDPSQGDVFVVDQVNKDGSFDEHKVMYGFPDIESARKAYLSNYEDGWQGLGAITPVSKEEFKKWIDSSHRKTKPFAEYSSVKPLGDMLLGEQPNKPTVKPKMAGGRRKAKGAQRKRMRMMESLARKLGYGIVWHDTMDENGLFDPETRTIHIALDAEVPLAAVFGHETMHKIAENREDYESVRDLARNVLGKEEFRRRVDECERRYRDAGYDKPRGYYEEEAVCDFMGEMLYNAGLLERVCWDANHRVLAAIRDVIDRILAALDLSDENMMRIRLTVSAAYKRAIERAKVEDAGSASGERRFSLLRKEEVDARSAEYHAKHDTGVTQEVYDAAQRAMDSMYGMMLPYYDATALGRRMLPEERYGGKDAKSTIFENGSYGKTMENTLKCIRTLAYNEFTDDVKRVLGRPLTQKESFLASQMVYDIAADPQCLYCYVSLDRKAYDEFLLRYMQQRDEVLDKFRAMGEKGRDIGDAAPHQALSDLYGEYLSGRKDTKEQRSRFDMWIRNEMDGVRAVGGADLATADVRSAVLSGLDESMARQVRDAEKYAQSASWAKKDVDYISYIGELLRLSPAWIKKLTGEYGLRFYSFSEYTPAFLLENMQMVRDAALRGLRGLGYTKEVDFVKVFAPTGMNINCSCYGRLDGEGRMQMDTLQGADWDEVKALREKYGNVGAVFVATNDACVEWALGQDWIDVVIPFHIVRTGQDIADFYGWSNYSREQADSVVGGSRKMYISPVEHKNDKGAFLEACKRHGVVPRFSKWLDNPNYMKLVNETRLSVDESADLKPVFDMDAAKDSWERFVNRGGYYNGWWNVDAQGYADAVRTVVEDIRSGKMAGDAEYGNQRMPVNPEKMIAAARKKRIHGNVPLVDVYDRSGNVLPSGGKRASVRKQKGAASGRELTDGERSLRDALVEKLRGAGIEVIADAEEGQRVLDEENGGGVRMQAKKRALETVSVTSKEEHQPTVVSSADGVKILKELDETKEKYENISNRVNTFIGDVATALGAKRDGSKSEYATFETKNGRIVTIRLADHNATVSNFDRRGELDGISIVVSPKKSEGVMNDGDAHVVEYYYDAIKLRRADGKPLADIVRSIKQALYSGEFKDTTRLAKRQEVNADGFRFFRTAYGQAYGFTVGGKIYIDPRIATAETPIHEYAHLWASAMREVNPEEWRNIVGLMKGTGVWYEVKRTYPELKTDDEIADEVLAHYSGRRGAERLRAEQEKIANGDGDVVEKAEAISALNRVKDALKRFWKGVADWLGVRFTSAEDVADKVLSDLLNGVDPNAGRNGASNARRIQADAEIAEIVAKAKADGTYMKAPNGKPSKLSPRQWAQVRTKAFKRWFGDWEKSYENGEKLLDCSKIVDENGEPRVVYHQTNSTIFVNKKTGENFDDLNWKEKYYWKNEASEEERNDTWEEQDFYVFDNKTHGRRSVEMPAFFFSPVYDEYHEYGDRTVAAFLNIRNPIVNPNIPNIGVTDTAGEDAMNDLIAQGYDGFIREYDGEVEEINAFFPNQIKSATDNVGTFDGNNPDIRYQFVGDLELLNDVNSRFNDELARLTDENKDKVVLSLGRPSDILLAAGVEDKPMKLYGNKVVKKMKKHGFALAELKDLPRAVADPIAVFDNYQLDGNRTVLTELQSKGKNIMVAVTLGKDGVDVDFNIVSSVFGKGEDNIVDWFNKGYARYINKAKALDYLHHSNRHISEALSNPKLVSASKIVESFENPKVSDGNVIEDTAMYRIRRGGVPGSVMTAAERSRLGDAARGFASGIGLGEVDVYDRIEDVPGYEGMDERQRRAKGWFDPATGRVAVVAGNHVDAADIQQTVLHEAVAHKGLRELLGDRFDGFLDGVLKNADEGVRAGITDLAKENGWDFRRATEEYLAGLAEDGRFAEAGAGWWKRVKRMFVEMLRAAGFGGRRISDGDLRYVLWRSLSHMKGDTGVLGRAEDVLMQYRLSVGNYGADVTRGAYVGGPLMAAGGAYSESVNRRFNEELERQMNGTLDKGHIYQLGVPSSILRSTGIPGLPIQMSASRLEEKATRYGHDFSLDEIKDLVNALQHPLAVFEYGDKKKAQNIIVEIQKDGKNFVVGLSIRPTVNGRVLEINSIRNVFPKNNAEWLNWISQGKSIYLDKEKIQALIAQQRTILADVDYLDLDSVAKIVENFENPSVGGGILYRDGDVSDGTREAYDAAVNQGRKGTLRLTRYNFREAFQDELLSLKLLQDIVEKKYGVELRGFEDAYLAENRLASMNEKDRKRFLDMFYEPMMEEVDRLIGDGASQEEINRYIMAKSGLERNREFAVRDYFRDLEKEAREMDDETARQAALDKIRQDSDAYDSERDRIRQEVRNGTKSWLDAHDELMALAERTVGGAPVRDYSGLSGMFGENDFERAAADFVLSFESGHETDEVWKRIRATNDETLRKCMESGMIDGAARARIGGMFDYYVPLRGFDDKTVDDVYAYVGIEGDGGAGKVMAKAKGRTTVAKDPLAVMAVMGERAILQGNRNWVKQHLLNMALNRPTDVCRAGRMWYVYDPVEQVWKESYPAIPDDATPEEADDVITQWEEDMRIASNTEITVKDKNGNDVKVKGATQRKEDLNVDYIVPPGSRFRSEHAVRVMRGGKEYVVFVHGNPRAAQAVNGLLKHGADGLMLVYHNLKRMYSSALTQYNVNFAGANIARDVQHSLFITLVNSGVKEAVRLAGYIPRVAPALARYIAGRPKAGSRVDAYVREFMENGGETGYAIAQSVDTWIADNASRTKRVGKGRRAARFAYDMTIGKMADWFSVANRMLEGNTRLAAYVASREGGDSVERAVKKAKDITVNFNKKGSGHTPGGWGQLANFYRNWFMFANPIIQGTFQFYDSMKMHPWRFAGMASTFLTAGMLVPMLNQALVAAFGGDDDDYYNLNEYTRRSNLMLFTGDGYVKIPLPQTLRNLYALGDIVMGVFNGRTDADDALPEMWNELCGMLSLEQLKVGGGLKGFGHNLLGGSMFAPVSDVVFNEKFNGMPIYKENVFGGRRAEYLNVYGGTWSFLVDASRLLNDATNGDYLFARSPYVGQMLNPAVLQHLLTNYTGGIGQAVGDVSSLASDLIGGELSDNFSWRTVPVAKRFYQDMDEITVNSAYKRRFDGIASKLKDLDEEIKETKRRIKDGDRSLYDHLNRLERTEDYGRLRRMKRYQGKIRRAKSPEDVAKIRRMAVDEFEMEADGRRR